MRIAFIGAKMIPANYGGNETFVEELSKQLIKKGYDVTVTCESDKIFEDEYYGIQRIFSPALRVHTTIPVINDVISTIILLAKYHKQIDVICYVAPDGVISAFFAKLFFRKKIIINTDGIEWKRLEKRNKFTRWCLHPLNSIVSKFLFFMEFLCCIVPDITIADSESIKKHLEKTHNAKKVVTIAYGARTLLDSNIYKDKEQEILKEYNLKADNYYLTVARIVPENNIHMEIEGYIKLNSKKQLVIVGNFYKKDRYSNYLFSLKEKRDNIIFLDPIYDKTILGILRKNCYAYIHNYELGGTNPSLLEQMLFSKPILAYDVEFHREVLHDGGIFFSNSNELFKHLKKLERNEINLRKNGEIFSKRISEQYNWEQISDQYERILNFSKGIKYER